MVASAIRSIFEQPDERLASEQLRRVADGLQSRFPAVANLLTEAEPDLLAHFTFPETHRRQIRSTNPQERLNKEIKRRTAVVGVFPSRASLKCLVGMVLAEQDDEWQDGRRYFRPESMAPAPAQTPGERRRIPSFESRQPSSETLELHEVHGASRSDRTDWGLTALRLGGLA